MAKIARMFLHIGTMVEVERFRETFCLPLEARELSRRALLLYDYYLEAAVGKLQRKGWRMYCSPGCAACCYAMPAGISSWELILIYDHLQQSGQLERFFRRNLECCQVLSRVKREVAARMPSGQTEAPEDYDNRVLYSYSLARKPCAFLSKSRECLIYSLRPLACRMHFSFTPGEWCDPADPRFRQAVRLNFRPHSEVQEHLRRLETRLGLEVSDLLAPGLVTLTANIMRFSAISWMS